MTDPTGFLSASTPAAADVLNRLLLVEAALRELLDAHDDDHRSDVSTERHAAAIDSARALCGEWSARPRWRWSNGEDSASTRYIDGELAP